jgi:hypothetical protein
MSRIVDYAGLAFKGGYTVNTCRIVCRNIAGLLTAMLESANEGLVYKGGIVRAAAGHGLITEKPREITAEGHAWLNGYRGDVAPLPDIIRPAPMPTYTRKERTAKGVPPRPKPTAKPNPTPKPSTVARDLMAAGLVFVHPRLIDDLSTEELALWIKAKRHERDGLTLAALAALLGEPLAHVRIRAERIVAKGYVVAVRDEEAA